MAHLITHDHGDYFHSHFGCVAYDYSRGPLSYENRNTYKCGPKLYQCCNNKVEGFDLTRSRHALLKVLLLQSPDNFEAFAQTLSCGQHDSGMAVSWTRSLWFKEMACTNRKWSGSCPCCNIRKPQYRWDAGMSAEERQLALSVTAHMAPTSGPQLQMAQATLAPDAVGDKRVEGKELAAIHQNPACVKSQVAQATPELDAIEDEHGEGKELRSSGTSTGEVSNRSLASVHSLLGSVSVRDVAVACASVFISTMIVPRIVRR